MLVPGGKGIVLLDCDDEIIDDREIVEPVFADAEEEKGELSMEAVGVLSITDETSSVAITTFVSEAEDVVAVRVGDAEVEVASALVADAVLPRHIDVFELNPKNKLL